MRILETTCEELGCQGRCMNTAESLIIRFLPELQCTRSCSVQGAKNVDNQRNVATEIEPRTTNSTRSEFRAACCSVLLACLGFSLDEEDQQGSSSGNRAGISKEMLHNQNGDSKGKTNENVVVHLATFLAKSQSGMFPRYSFTQGINSGQLPYLGVLDILKECMSFLRGQAKSQPSKQQTDECENAKTLIMDIEKEIVLTLRHYDAFEDLWEWSNEHGDIKGIFHQGDIQHRNSMRECAWLMQVIVYDFNQSREQGAEVSLDVLSQFEEDEARKKWLGAALVLATLPVGNMPSIVHSSSNLNSETEHHRMLEAVSLKVGSDGTESLCKDMKDLSEALQNCALKHNYLIPGRGWKFQILLKWLGASNEKSSNGPLFASAIRDELRLLYSDIRNRKWSSLQINAERIIGSCAVDAAVLYQQPLVRKFVGRSPKRETTASLSQFGSNVRATKKLKTEGTGIGHLPHCPARPEENPSRSEQSINGEGIPYPSGPPPRQYVENTPSYAKPQFHTYTHPRAPPQARVGGFNYPHYPGTGRMWPYPPPPVPLASMAPPIPNYPMHLPPHSIPPPPGFSAGAYTAPYPRSYIQTKEPPRFPSSSFQVPGNVLSHVQRQEMESFSRRLEEEKELSKPGPLLTEFLDHSGGITLWNHITSILDGVLKVLGVNFLSAISDDPADDEQSHSFQMSFLALYYQSLEAILTLETQRVGTKNHKKLLNNSDFHKSLLAVVAECIFETIYIMTGTEESQNNEENNQQNAHLNEVHEKNIASGKRRKRRNVLLPFPDVLKLLNVSPFDFCKVCETFIRALWSQEEALVPFGRIKKDGAKIKNSEDTWIQPLGLPLQLRQNLTICEDMILEKLLWENVSTNINDSTNCSENQCNIFNSIKAMKSYHTKMSQLHESTGKKPSKKSNALGWPPLALVNNKIMNVEDKRVQMSCIPLLLMKTALAPNIMSSEEQETYIKQYRAVSFVFRKIVTLMSRRLLAMTIILRLNVFFTGQIWVTFLDILADQDEKGTLDLVMNRHMDQLLLCTIYGVCKIANVQPDVSFRNIINAYGQLELNRTKEENNVITRKIPITRKNKGSEKDNSINESSSTGNIIQFYNQMFVSKAKQYLVKHQFHAKEQRARANISNMDDATRLATLAEVAMSSREVSSDGTDSTISNSEWNKDRGRKEGSNSNLIDPLSESTHEAKVKALPVKGMIHMISPYAIEGTNIRVGLLKSSDQLEAMDCQDHGPSMAGDTEFDKERKVLMKRQVYHIGQNDPQSLVNLNRTVHFQMPLMSQKDIEEEGIKSLSAVVE